MDHHSRFRCGRRRSWLGRLVMFDMQCSGAQGVDDVPVLLLDAHSASGFARLDSGVKFGVAGGMLVDHASADIDGGIDLSVIRAAIFRLDVKRTPVDANIGIESHVHHLYGYHIFMTTTTELYDYHECVRRREGLSIFLL